MPSGGAGAAAGADAAVQEGLDASQLEGPWHTADSLGYDEVIDPRELRNALIDALETASGRLSEQPTPTTRRGVLP
jgi:acetyl-CoA carboxylase carboxyltransferase component